MTWADTCLAPEWLGWAIACFGAAALAAWWSAFSAPISWPQRFAVAFLQIAGFALLALCLLEPAMRRELPIPQANSFAILVDRSRSLDIRDQGSGHATRADRLRRLLVEDDRWQAALADSFDLRRFYFDRQLTAVNDFSEYQASESGSALGASLEALARRLQSKACAGILLFTDGNRTDEGPLPQITGVPIYPVQIAGKAVRDLSIKQVHVSESNFEAAPVMVTIEAEAQGFAGSTVVAELLNQAGEVVRSELVAGVVDNKRFAIRFEDRPVGPGPHFYTVRVRDRQENELVGREGGDEATYANNTRTIAIDRNCGYYRILYVAGRPNWELKFLDRALAEDEEIELLKLLRVAKREPKFSFRSRAGESSNPLFRGFNNVDDAEAAAYDEPVLIALPVGHPVLAKLERKFPVSAEQLYPFSAVILDDIEADFFTPDQQALLQQFVAERGGTLLMLGGIGSFEHGQYERTPIGQMLPIYLNRGESTAANGSFRWDLTREGWLQSWMRLRSTESQETERLRSMPAFEVYSRARLVKPGATVLAQVRGEDGMALPGLVTQKFGKGNTAALLVGDFWRWQMKRPDHDDLSKFWRQLNRWLVADVPQRLEVEINQNDFSTIEARIDVRDERFMRLDNARVTAEIAHLAADSGGTPETTRGSDHTNILILEATPSEREAGIYLLKYTPRQAGPYRITWTATACDGTEIGKRTSGWVCQPNLRELREINANQAVLDELATRSGGRILQANELDSFARSVPVNSALATEVKFAPWWHQPVVFMTALGCLITAWGLRRWRGLP